MKLLLKVAPIIVSISLVSFFFLLYFQRGEGERGASVISRLLPIKNSQLLKEKTLTEEQIFSFQSCFQVAR